MGTPVRRPAATLLFALALSGCAGVATRSRTSTDRSVITRAQIEERHFNTAYDAVEALRSNWLLTRGPDSFQNPTVVQVYLDQNRMGGIDQLKTINARTIASIRYYDGVAATARWGLEHGAGAIVVTTQP